MVPLSSAYAISEAVGVERSVSRRFTEARLFLGLFGVQVLIGASLALTHINLITLLIGTQVLQGIVTPVILVFILILTNRRSVLGKAANRPVFQVVATHLRGRHLGDEPARCSASHRPRLLRHRLTRRPPPPACPQGPPSAGADLVAPARQGSKR